MPDQKQTVTLASAWRDYYGDEPAPFCPEHGFDAASLDGCGQWVQSGASQRQEQCSAPVFAVRPAPEGVEALREAAAGLVELFAGGCHEIEMLDSSSGVAIPDCAYEEVVKRLDAARLALTSPPAVASSGAEGVTDEMIERALDAFPARHGLCDEESGVFLSVDAERDVVGEILTAAVSAPAPAVSDSEGAQDAAPEGETGPIGPGTPHARMHALWDALGERRDFIAAWSDYNPMMSDVRGVIEHQAIVALDRLAAAASSSEAPAHIIDTALSPDDLPAASAEGEGERAEADVRAERQRQDEKWGEVAKEAADSLYKPLRGEEYRTEMVQVAAVALQAVECFDRNAAPSKENDDA